MKTIILDVLEKEVFKFVKDVMKEHINSDVYDVYDPIVYKRRKTEQGLLDENNIVYDIQNNGTIVIYNIAKYNPYKKNKPVRTSFSKDKRIELEKLIIDGYSYYEGDVPYALPRPFIENTEASINKDGQSYQGLDLAFEEGLGRYQIKKKG